MTIKEKIALARRAHSKKSTMEDKMKLKEATKWEKTMWAIDKATALTTADRNKSKVAKVAKITIIKTSKTNMWPKTKMLPKTKMWPKTKMLPKTATAEYVSEVKSHKPINRSAENAAISDYLSKINNTEAKRIRKAKQLKEAKAKKEETSKQESNKKKEWVESEIYKKFNNDLMVPKTKMWPKTATKTYVWEVKSHKPIDRSAENAAISKYLRKHKK